MHHIPTQQVATAFRRRLGDVVVTALSDGYLDASFDLLTGIDSESGTKLLHAAGHRTPPRMNINTYIIQDGKRTILVDSGAGGLNGWGGRLQESLTAAGILPEDIDTILLTHAHPDHIGGMADSNGRALFPAVQQVFVQEGELAFWRSDSMRNSAPDGFRPFFDVARRAFTAYDGRIRTFKGETILPGINAIELHGHTPGHTGYLVESEGESLLIWGDIVHFPDIQVVRPEVTIAFDADSAHAARTRARVLDQASCEGFLFLGRRHAFHLPQLRTHRTKRLQLRIDERILDAGTGLKRVKVLLKWNYDSHSIALP
jgi:glyoxylase-like metal-dependent hydrolase (beta-lactamase superfamily II)